ncbi:MAG: HAD family hydrolase, partial [Bacteroidetes bacterium]|nr:HAD family hydrolase [Bacteroidota bacterium]
MKDALIFDWGGTVMRDFGYPGKMKDWSEVAWVPGMEQALMKLSGTYLCCIATNAGESDTSDMVAALGRIDAKHYFSCFFSSKDL